MENKLDTKKHCSESKFYGQEPSEPHLSKENALVQVLFYLAGTIDLYAIWLERIFNSQGKTFKHEMKRHFSGMSKAIKDLHYHADQLDIVVGNLENAVEATDNRLVGSLELARLILMYYEKCAFDDDNYKYIFRKMSGLDGDGMFSDEDIERFHLRK